MISTVVGGAMLPHAPQFFTMPETEDKANVEHVRAVAAEIGERLRALKPDLWIIFSNDHAEQFFHNAAPPFTVHVGGEALHGLAHDPDKRARYIADAPAYADEFKLSPDQREALIKLDMPTIVNMGAHPPSVDEAKRGWPGQARTSPAMMTDFH